MTKLRLGLSLSSIRRVFGPSEVTEQQDDGFGQFIVQQSHYYWWFSNWSYTQRGDFIALNQDAPILVANRCC